MYEYGTLKSVEIILKGEWGRRENNGGDEPNWSITCIYENITTKPSEKLSYTNKNI
jgi:hypothetical protein